MARNPSPESSKTDPKENGRSFVQVEWGKFVEERKEKENGTETIFVKQKRKIFEAKNVFCSVFLPFSHQLE